MRLVWSTLALERVHEVAEHIARDRPVPELAHRPELREVIHGAYRMDSEQVSVLTVRHGRRLLDPADVSEEGG